MSIFLYVGLKFLSILLGMLGLVPSINSLLVLIRWMFFNNFNNRQLLRPTLLPRSYLVFCRKPDLVFPCYNI